MISSISGVISGAVSMSVPRLGYYLGINDFKAYDSLYKSSILHSNYNYCGTYGNYVRHAADTTK